MTESPAARIEIVPLSTIPADQIVPMIARAMRDNPQHVAVFGDDAATRERQLTALFGLMAGSPALYTHSLAATLDGRFVGICGLVEPGRCQPTTSQRLKMLPGLFRLGMGNARRVGTWLGAWSKQDPATAHWHVGPVAVAADLQGKGIGSRLMAEAMTIVDASGQMAWLETDKNINVTFYERLGFQVAATESVVGNTNWFMARQPAVVEQS